MGRVEAVMATNLPPEVILQDWNLWKTGVDVAQMLCSLPQTSEQE